MRSPQQVSILPLDLVTDIQRLMLLIVKGKNGKNSEDCLEKRMGL